MRTDVDRLQFAIRFAQSDTASMREGDKLNVRDDLFLFAHGFPYQSEDDMDVNAGDVFLHRKDEIRKMPDQAIEKVRLEFLGILHDLSMPPGRSRFASIEPLSKLRFYIAANDDKGMIVFASSEDPREVILYRLIRLLESSVNTKRLMICPECRRIFLKVKRQRYCSARCASRAYMRKYRASGGESDANHRAYAKRTKKQLGAKVRINRRRS